MAAFTQAVELTAVPYHQSLMTEARRLIDDGQFNLAVIVVHMACEIATEQKLSEAFTTKGFLELQEQVMAFLNGYNLAANNKIRKLYVSLTSDEVHKCQFWSKFKKSATRRNQIIHKGVRVDKAAAEESYQAADALLVHFNIT
jgi:hypothetical protein